MSEVVSSRWMRTLVTSPVESRKGACGWNPSSTFEYGHLTWSAVFHFVAFSLASCLHAARIASKGERHTKMQGGHDIVGGRYTDTLWMKQLEGDPRDGRRVVMAFSVLFERQVKTWCVMGMRSGWYTNLWVNARLRCAQASGLSPVRHLALIPRLEPHDVLTRARPRPSSTTQ